MNRTRSAVAAVAASALVAGSAVALAAPSFADGPERSANLWFGYTDVDFDVEKERGRFEVGVDVDDATPGSKWRVVLRHDGKVVHAKTHRADREGEIEINKVLRDTAGKDTFKLVVTKVGTGKPRAAKIVMR